MQEYSTFTDSFIAQVTEFFYNPPCSLCLKIMATDLAHFMFFVSGIFCVSGVRPAASPSGQSQVSGSVRAGLGSFSNTSNEHVNSVPVSSTAQL